MARVRLALSTFVPDPEPGGASARVAAAVVMPRPGLAGTTARPSVAPSCSPPTAVGVQPSWLPGIDHPVAVPAPAKADACPDISQPGWVSRLSVTVMSRSAPVAVAPDTVMVTVPGLIVTENRPDRGSLPAINRAPP